MKEKMKKILSVVLCLAYVIGLFVGCASKDNNPTENTTLQQIEETDPTGSDTTNPTGSDATDPTG